MKPVRYVLKAGDTLWSVAEAHYGDPVRWPDLYAYNNRPDIVALTERSIVDPGRLAPGQTIFLPPGEARSSQRRAPASAATKGGAPASGLGGSGLTGGIRGAQAGATLMAGGLAPNPAAETFVNDFAHGFNLDGTRLSLRGEGFTATLTLSGLVLLQRTGRVPLMRYSNRAAEAQARGQSALVLGRLLATDDTRLGWNPGKARIRLETPLADHAGAGAPDAAAGAAKTARAAAAASDTADASTPASPVSSSGSGIAELAPLAAGFAGMIGGGGIGGLLGGGVDPARSAVNEASRRSMLTGGGAGMAGGGAQIGGMVQQMMGGMGGIMNTMVSNMRNDSTGLASTRTIGVSDVKNVGQTAIETVGHAKNLGVGQEYTVQVGDRMLVQVGTELKIVVGKSELIMDKDGNVTILGANFDFTASGPVKINGKVIDLNLPGESS